MDFEAVLKRYESQHNSSGTDKTTTHAYGPLYSQLMAPLRDTARRVLEIGVFSGASVLAMAEFFEHAHVDGVDITLDAVRFGNDHPRIHYHRMDGTKSDAAEAVRRLCGGGAPFDVILDDASHRPDDQLATLEAFLPHMAPGGVFIVEDIDGSLLDACAALHKRMEQLADAHGVSLTWHDLRWVKGQFDDIVAVFSRQHAEGEAPARG